MPSQSLTKDAAFDEAVGKAANLLSAASLPVIAGLQADVAGLVAAARLAERVGGVIDHAAALPSLREHAALRDVGLMFATPGLVREADTLLLVGGGLADAAIDICASGSAGAVGRVIVLGSDAPVETGGHEVFRVAAHAAGLAGLLGAIRARLNGRPLAAGFDAADIEVCVERLAAAHYGIALWNPEALAPLEIEMLIGLVKDLNRNTRWSARSVAPDSTAVATTIALGWMTGLPARTGFPRGFAEHDAWRFDARRLVESGEADIVLWVSAFGEQMPGWLDPAAAIVLLEPPLPLPNTAVAFAVGQPGRDHAAVLYDPAAGTLAEHPARSPSDLPSVSLVLTRIREALPAP
jgi:formylmethanofuran dehydrogenase subunit B